MLNCVREFYLKGNQDRMLLIDMLTHFYLFIDMIIFSILVLILLRYKNKIK